MMRAGCAVSVIPEKMRAALAQAASRAAAARQSTTASTPKRAGPTPEQRQHARYELEPITERGQVVGRAYRKQPWFETLAARGDISSSALEALRFYRNSYESSFYSEMRCALDRSGIGGRGSSYAMISEPPEVSIAKSNLAGCERGISSPLLDSLRAVGLYDLRYREVAMERFGYRMADYIENGKHLQKRAPKSGRHRELVKDEILAAVELLIANVAAMARNER